MAITTLLAIDAGNTNIKAAIFTNDTLIYQETFLTIDWRVIQQIIDKYKPSHAILSSVNGEMPKLESILASATLFIKLTNTLRFPFENLYATPHTLGMDRAAAVAGATFYVNCHNCLIIDAGTCITYDFLSSSNQFLGGAIAPGLQMRLNAMHNLTQKLPLFVAQTPADFIGTSTETAMLSGAYFGLLDEINGTIERYQMRFGELKIIMCGGDLPFFDKRTKNTIFAAPNLVLMGLNKIAQLNV